MSKYDFFYDESEHSRKINYNTVSALNYYDNFVVAIVGWPSEYDNVLQRYDRFEKIYYGRKDKNGEIKSTTLKSKELKFGFASLSEQNVKFLNDFLSIFDKNTYVFCSIHSKVEYIVSQLFNKVSTNIVNSETWKINKSWWVYSITKALVLYHPKEVIKCIYEEPQNFVSQLKSFFQSQIAIDIKNLSLKKQEINVFKQIILLLNNISINLVLEWDYHKPFNGFQNYLCNKNILDYSLIIDKEGTKDKDSNTLVAARDVGIYNPIEENSEKYKGLQIADMFAGIIAKLLKALSIDLYYNSFDDGANKKLLNVKWFSLKDFHLELYKKLYRIICEQQSSVFTNKSIFGVYSDNLITMFALLEIINKYKDEDQMKLDQDELPNKVNSWAVYKIQEYYKYFS